MELICNNTILWLAVRFQDEWNKTLLENKRLEAYIDNLAAEIDKKRKGDGEQKK